MPYSVAYDVAGCDGWAVVKDGTGEMMGCHRSEDAAQDQLTALNIAEFGDDERADAPPAYIRRAARRGLELRAQGLGGDGLVDRTIREAREMAAGRVSDDKAIRAAAWGARHAVDLDAPKNSNASDPEWPGPGAVAHYLWGIDPLNPQPARRWFERQAERIREGEGARTMTLPIEGRLREARISQGMEIRRQDGGLVFRGYASVTEHAYDVGGGVQRGGWSEIISRGAFRRSLGMHDNRALLAGHDHNRVVATTRGGSLAMAEDNVGLLVEARLDTRVSWIADLATQVENGDVDEMSVGFFARQDSWSKDFVTRTISEVELVEASIVWAGANPATVASVERIRTALAEARCAATVPALVSRVALAAHAAAAQLSLR
jgi:HK97 family phage prohead protease